MTYIITKGLFMANGLEAYTNGGKGYIHFFSLIHSVLPQKGMKNDHNDILKMGRGARNRAEVMK